MFPLLLVLAGLSQAAEQQFYADLRIRDESVSVQRIWRHGADLIRRETDDDKDWGGRRIEITRGADAYTLDEQELTAWRAPTGALDGRAHAPIFDIPAAPSLEGLEYGREIDFFRSHNAADKPAYNATMPVNGAIEQCRCYKLSLDNVGLTLCVGADGRPRSLSARSQSGSRTVEYAQYVLKSGSTARFELPKGFKVATGTRARNITGKERGTDQWTFNLLERGGKRFANQLFCRQRPAVFYFFTPGQSAPNDERRLQILDEKYGRGRACFFPLPVSGPALTPAPGLDVWQSAQGRRVPLYQLNARWTPLGRPTPVPGLVVKTAGGSFFVLDLANETDFQRALSIAEQTVNETPANSGPEDDPVTRWIDDPQRREPETFAMEIQALMGREDFGALDALARRLRDRKERFSNGVWKIHAYYDMLLATSISTEEARLKRVAFLTAWINAHPTSVAPRIALGDLWLQYSFQGRGGGWASALNGNQKRHMGDRIVIAQKTLNEARGLQEKDPELYVELLRLAKAASWSAEDTRVVYNEGTAWFPSYQYLHVEMANYLDPRWHGDLGDGEALLEKVAVDNAGGLGDEQYARAALLMHTDLRFAPYGERFFKLSDFSWPRVKKGFLDMEKRYPDSQANLNYFAFFASIAGDRPTARELFQRIGENYRPAVWGNRGYYERWRSWARREPPDYSQAFGSSLPAESSPVYLRPGQSVTVQPVYSSQSRDAALMMKNALKARREQLLNRRKQMQEQQRQRMEDYKHEQMSRSRRHQIEEQVRRRKETAVPDSRETAAPKSDDSDGF